MNSGRHEGIILLNCLVAEITRKSYLTSASQFHRNLSQAKPSQTINEYLPNIRRRIVEPPVRLDGFHATHR